MGIANIIEMLSWIIQQDLNLLKYVQQHRFSLRVERIFKFYTRLGDGYIWALIFIYLLWGNGIAEMFNGVSGLLWQALASAAVSLALYWIIKLKVRRPRPFSVMKGVEAEIPPLDVYSFPSGHTMNNIAVGFTLFYHVPEIGWIMIIMPITWGFLRIYFGVHWLSDIIGGLIFGFLSFLIAHLLWIPFSLWVGH